MPEMAVTVEILLAVVLVVLVVPVVVYLLLAKKHNHRSCSIGHISLKYLGEVWPNASNDVINCSNELHHAYAKSPYPQLYLHTSS